MWGCKHLVESQSESQSVYWAYYMHCSANDCNRLAVIFESWPREEHNVPIISKGLLLATRTEILARRNTADSSFSFTRFPRTRFFLAFHFFQIEHHWCNGIRIITVSRERCKNRRRIFIMTAEYYPWGYPRPMLMTWGMGIPASASFQSCRIFAHELSSDMEYSRVCVLCYLPYWSTTTLSFQLEEATCV